ncbi:PAS domain-containing protein [Sphingomonas sp. CJ20]
MQSAPIPGADYFSVAREVPLAGTWECDLADDSLRWSTAVYDIFGIAPGSRLDRQGIVQLYAPESRDTLAVLRADAIARGSSFTFEARICRPDGATRWVRITADIACRNGRPAQLYGTKQDITEEWVPR